MKVKRERAVGLGIGRGAEASIYCGVEGRKSKGD